MISVKTAAAEIVKTVEWQELRHNELFSAPGGVSCQAQVHVPNPSPKYKVQSPEERDWDCGAGKRPFMTFYSLLSISMTFMIKCLL